MVAITFKNNGAWGTGKGSRLVSLEVDDNFFSIKQAVEALQDNPTLPLEINDVTISGKTLTFHLSDLTTTFSVDIPAAQFAFRDDWAPGTNYNASDFVVDAGGLYIVLQDHTSNPTFSSTDGNVNGPYYRLVIKAPTEAYEVSFYVKDPTIAGSFVLDSKQFVQSAYIPGNAVGSFAQLRTPPTGPVTFMVSQDDVGLCFIHFGAGETVGVFSTLDEHGLNPGTPIQFNPGNVMQVFVNGTADPDASDLTITLLMVLGTIES